MFLPIALADLSSRMIYWWNNAGDIDSRKTLAAIKADSYLASLDINLDEEDTDLQQITLKLTSLSVSITATMYVLDTHQRIIDFIKDYLGREREEADGTQDPWLQGLKCLGERIVFLDEVLNSDRFMSKYLREIIQAQIQTVFL
jgi:hypothetical protein